MSTAVKGGKKGGNQTPKALLKAEVMSKHLRAKALNQRIAPPAATVARSLFEELELRKIRESPGGSPEAQKNLLRTVHSAWRSGVAAEWRQIWPQCQGDLRRAQAVGVEVELGPQQQQACSNRLTTVPPT